MQACGWWWVAMLLVTWAAAAPSSEKDTTGNRLDDPSSAAANVVEDAAVSAVAAASSAGSGGLFGPQLRVILGALENVDDMLRSTIPTIDRFQCIERLMCSVMSAGSSTSSSPITSLVQEAFDPTFQQGPIQDPQAIQQEILQNPALQGLLSQFQQGLTSQTGAFQQGLTSQNPAFHQAQPSQIPTFQQGFPPQDPAFQQQGFPPQDPAFQQQGFPPQDPAFQHQGFPPQAPAFQQQGFLPQNPAFPPPPGFNPQFQTPPDQVVQGSFQTFQPFHEGTSFQNSFANFRENPDTQNIIIRRTNGQPRPLRRRRPSRRPQRNGFFDFLGRLGLGRRKKRSSGRSLFDNFFSGFTSNSIMTLIDRMMSDYSFYPYTHAAFMGYSGESGRCESLYPSCPSTADEMINVFNNIHQHYPQGFPYKENLPWPLNVLLP